MNWLVRSTSPPACRQRKDYLFPPCATQTVTSVLITSILLALPQLFKGHLCSFTHQKKGAGNQSDIDEWVRQSLKCSFEPKHIFCSWWLIEDHGFFAQTNSTATAWSDRSSRCTWRERERSTGICALSLKCPDVLQCARILIGDLLTKEPSLCAEDVICRVIAMMNTPFCATSPSLSLLPWWTARFRICLSCWDSVCSSFTDNSSLLCRNKMSIISKEQKKRKTRRNSWTSADEQHVETRAIHRVCKNNPSTKRESERGRKICSSRSINRDSTRIRESIVLEGTISTVRRSVFDPSLLTGKWKEGDTNLRNTFLKTLTSRLG